MLDRLVELVFVDGFSGRAASPRPLDPEGTGLPRIAAAPDTEDPTAESHGQAGDDDSSTGPTDRQGNSTA
jgi:hypothetical protein